MCVGVTLVVTLLILVIGQLQGIPLRFGDQEQCPPPQHPEWALVLSLTAI